MLVRRISLLGVLGAFLSVAALAGDAFDVVELESGRLEGTIVEDTPERIVLRLRSGEAIVPRSKVRRIFCIDGRMIDVALERDGKVFEHAWTTAELPQDDRAFLKAELARRVPRSAVALGLPQRADRHFVQREYRPALACLDAARVIAPEEFPYRNELENRIRELEKRIRVELAEQAIERRDAKEARFAIGSLLERTDVDKRKLHYLEGRAAELEGRAEVARAAYRQALCDFDLKPKACEDLRLLRALAARSFQPGTGQLIASVGNQAAKGGFCCCETEHLTIFVPSALSQSTLDDLEGRRTVVLRRLGLVEKPSPVRVCIFVFKTKELFARATLGPEWAAGCAFQRSVEGGEGTVVTYEDPISGLDWVFDHELAHVFVAEAFGLTLPTWAQEGVACYAERESVRIARRQRLMDLNFRFGGMAVIPLETVLALGRDGLSALSGERASVFYSESAAIFDRLVKSTGSLATALLVASQQREHELFAQATVERIGAEALAEVDPPAVTEPAPPPPASEPQPRASSEVVAVASVHEEPRRHRELGLALMGCAVGLACFGLGRRLATGLRTRRASVHSPTKVETANHDVVASSTQATRASPLVGGRAAPRSGAGSTAPRARI